MPVSGSSHLMTATRQTRVSQPKASTSSSSNNDGRVTRSSAAAAAATTTTPAARSAPDDEDEESDADVVIVKRRTSGRQPRMNAAYHAAVSTNKRPSSSSSRAEASLSKTSNDTSTTNTGDRSSARSSFVLSPMTTQTTSTPNDAKRVESREPREIQDDDGHMDVDEQEQVCPRSLSFQSSLATDNEHASNAQTTPSKKRAREPSLQQEKSDVVTPTKPNKGKQRAEDAEVSSSHLASPPDSHQRGQRKRARHDSGPLQAATNVFVCDRDSEEEQVDESEDVYEEAEDEESTAMPTPVRTPSKKSAGPTATTATTTSTPPSTERRRSNRQAGFGPSPLKKTLPDVLEDARDRTPEPAGLADDDDDDYWTELQQHQEEDVEDHSRAAKRLLFSRDQLDELVDRVARNLHMTGRDDPSISPAAAWEQSVRYTLDGAVSRGVGNCMLLVGPRGSGKSRAVDGALSSLAAEHGKNAFITVRLSGLAQTTDRLAMREIARQLCAADRRVDEHEGDFGSHASTMATLLRLLEPPSDSTLPNVTEEGSDAQRSAPLTMRDVPVLFVLDEFDLFALHPRQSFLYCLLDIVQGNRRRAGMAVLGLTSRVDVLSTSVLEKRVRSRCSSNVLNFAHERSFESFELLARSMLVLREPAAEADHAWNAEVDAFLADRPVREYLERLYNIDGMTPAPLKSTLVEMLSHVEHKLMMADGPARIPRLSVNDLRPLAASMTRSTVLRSLSMLEVYVLIAAKHARSLSSADDDRKRTFNLEILYDRYSKHVARRRRTEPTLRKVPKQAFAIVRLASSPSRARGLPTDMRATRLWTSCESSRSSSQVAVLPPSCRRRWSQASLSRSAHGASCRGTRRSTTSCTPTPKECHLTSRSGASHGVNRLTFRETHLFGPCHVDDLQTFSHGSSSKSAGIPNSAMSIAESLPWRLKKSNAAARLSARLH